MLPVRPTARGVAVLAVVVLAGTAGFLAPSRLQAVPEAARVASSAERPAAAAGFEVTSREDPGQPVRWLACRPVPYRINPHAMPEGLDRTIRRTLDEVGEQTGVRFVDAGRTTRTFDATRYDRTAPTLYFSFTDEPRASGVDFSWPGTIGVGGPASAWAAEGGRTFEAITYGRVLLYSGFDGERMGTGQTWQALITHEVGHALNLEHRADEADAMHPALLPTARSRFSADELAALDRVLQRTGCDYEAFARL